MTAERSGDTPWPSTALAIYTVVVLTLAYTCSFIDRQILTLLVDPIRKDLHVTDTQVSLLGGLAFTIFYTLLGVPIGRLADRANRRNIMAAGVATWSLMTAACGLARGFWPLFGARIGVGVGEAALSPAAFSVLADLFPPKRLGRAIGAYSTGIYFGAGLALIVGGAVIKKITSSSIHELPFIGTILPWQLVFFVVGALGLPVFLLMLTLREPRRRGAGSTAPRVDPSAWPALRDFIRTNLGTLTCHFSGYSLYGIAIGAYLFWAPVMMIRNFGWSAPRTGFTVGVILLVFGTAGVYTGGWVADRMAARGYRDALLRAAFVGMCCGLPFFIATPLAPNETLATIGLAVSIFFLAYPQGLPSAALQAMTPNPLRAQVTALYFLIGSFIASGIGPTLPALLNDFVFRDPLAMRYSLCIVVAIVGPLSIAIGYAVLGFYRASVERAGNG